MSNSEVHALLVQARETISDPARWCQGSLAQDHNGRPVNPIFDPDEAVRWCAKGALLKHRPAYDALACEALDKLSDAARSMRTSSTRLQPVVHVNDKRGHVAVIEMYNRAIAATAPAERGQP
jgi:hypothetical protein